MSDDRPASRAQETPDHGGDDSRSHSSISEWLRGLKAGEADAAQKLWERYAGALVGLARARLEQMPTRLVDAEDIAASVFVKLCRGAEAGRFARVGDRDELWWLLVMLTRRACVSHYRHESALKRGGGRVRNESDLAPGEAFEHLVSCEPAPEFLTAMDEEFSRLLGLLRDDTLRSIAIWRVEGCTAEEIRDRLGVSMSSVSRKLRLIRETWRGEFEQ